MNQQQQQANIVPITALSPFVGQGSGQAIRARVSEKGEIKTWNKPNSQGKLFSCVLNDETTSIRATFFNQSADDNFHTLENGCVYIFSNFVVKNANKQFNHTNNDYELTMGDNVSVTKTHNDQSIPTERYNFTLLKMLPAKIKNGGSAITDVLGIVIDLGTTTDLEVKRKEGDTVNTQKRTVLLAEPSGYSIELGLWEENCAKAGEWKIGDVIALKQVKIGTWNSCSISTFRTSTIVVNPTLPDAIHYGTWFRNGNRRDPSDFTPLSKKSGPNGDFNNPDDADKSKFNFLGRRFLSAIESEQLGKTPGKTDFFECVVTPTRFGNKGNTSATPYWYNACPKCMKKVQPIDDANNDTNNTTYTCAKCNGATYSEDQISIKYLFSLEVTDGINTRYVGFFDEAGAKFFGNKTARQVKDAIQEANRLYSENHPNQNNHNNNSQDHHQQGDQQQHQQKESPAAYHYASHYLNTPYLMKFKVNQETETQRQNRINNRQTSEDNLPADWEENRVVVNVNDAEPIMKNFADKFSKKNPVVEEAIKKKEEEYEQALQAWQEGHEDGELAPAKPDGKIQNLLLADEIDGMLELLSAL